MITILFKTQRTNCLYKIFIKFQSNQEFINVCIVILKNIEIYSQRVYANYEIFPVYIRFAHGCIPRPFWSRAELKLKSYIYLNKVPMLQFLILNISAVTSAIKRIFRMWVSEFMK